MWCDDPTLPTGPANLVIKAADRLKSAAKVTRGARIELFKQIPSQGGLAGGSSDAAATLAGLNRLWDLNLSTEELAAVAAGVGSDVSFFLHGPSAVCRGRGERVEPVESAQTYHFVLVCPPVGVSTAEAFARLTVPTEPEAVGATLEAFRSGDSRALGQRLFNRLQPVAEGLVPALRHVRDALQSLGPLLNGSMMSGSGSVYFGLARDRGAASAAANTLETLGLGQVRVVTCGP
jgi:4-diphosphocytidyl-2-C-methyl-D-erythritol kinase